MNTTRREFFAGAVALGAASMVRAAEPAAAVNATNKPLKVGVFADLHFHHNFFTPPSDTPEFLEQILARFEQAKVDMIIHLGDLMHNVRSAQNKAFLKRYNDFHIPTYNILGNHDQDGNPYKETVEAYRMPGPYYSFDRGGFRFVVTDPNYTKEDGKFIHHENGNYFRRSKTSTINWIPPEQMEWLEETLTNSPYPCLVLSHQSFERPSGSGCGVNNGREVCALFDKVNAAHPGRVRIALNGHMHTDYQRLLNNILYWDVNSANYYYYGPTHKAYPEAVMNERKQVQHCLGWDRALSAVLTLWPNGRIKIEGSSANWLYNVPPKQAGLPEVDSTARYILPQIASADFTLNI